MGQKRSSKNQYCSLCGVQVIRNGNVVKQFETKEFHDEKKRSFRIICSDCRGTLT